MMRSILAAMTAPLSASVIVIGDEILGGFVRDTNSGWLASRFQDHGVVLSRIAVVPDTFAAIDEALQTELERQRPRLVVTTGGIGSTPDDVTYEAVAASLDRELVTHPALERRIDGAISWTQAQGVDTDDQFIDHMMRMARIPEGSTLLRESSGSFAPGIRIDIDGGVDVAAGVTAVLLPGVPSQLHSIVSEVVEPDLLAGRGRRHTVAELTHSFPESALNRCFVRLGEDYPEVEFGSYPGDPMLVRLRGHPDEVEPAMAELEAYVADLEATPGGKRLREAWAARFQDRGGDEASESA